MGDWVSWHTRQEHFPSKRVSKLAPRGDGLFKVVAKINGNAYRLDLPGEFNISATFNVTDLSHFDAGESVLRTKPLEEGGNDTDIPAAESSFPVLEVLQAPMTRSKIKKLRNQFNLAIQRLINQLGDSEPDAPECRGVSCPGHPASIEAWESSPCLHDSGEV